MNESYPASAVVSRDVMRHHTGMERLTFGDWLRGMRFRHGEMTQQALADATGLQRSYIVKVETGRVQLPEAETRARFHAVFGTTEADLEQLGIVPRYDQWGRVLPGTANASGSVVTALAGVNPFDTGDLRWHVVEALRTLDMTSDQNEWLMQMFLRELKRDDYPRVPPNVIRDAG